jgi:thioredoxin 1
VPVIDVTEQQLPELLGTGKVLVEFYNPGCKFCKQMIPVVNEIAQEATVLRLKPEKEGTFAQEHGLSVTPSWVTFVDGKKVNQFSGATAKDILLKLFDPSFVPPAPKKPKELFVFSLGSLFRLAIVWIPGAMGTIRTDISFRVCRSCFS